MNAIEMLEKEHMRVDLPQFKSGDKVRVYSRIKEGDKERIQVFEGVVIRKRKVPQGLLLLCERSRMVLVWRNFSFSFSNNRQNRGNFKG